jgi:hypothetical protein
VTAAKFFFEEFFLAIFLRKIGVFGENPFGKNFPENFS